MFAVLFHLKRNVATFEQKYQLEQPKKWTRQAEMYAKARPGSPIPFSPARKLKPCKKAIKNFYNNATSAKEALRRTVGHKELVESTDKELIDRGSAYMISINMILGGATLDVGAGIGSRMHHLARISDEIHSFDADKKMVDFYNTFRIQELMKEHPLVLFAEMINAKLEEVEARNFDTIFINDLLCHLSDEEVVEQLKRICSWLSKRPIRRSKLDLRLTKDSSEIKYEKVHSRVQQIGSAGELPPLADDK